MRMFNADGSESEMCGNGVRCVAKYLYDHGLCRKKPTLTIETGRGVLTLDLELAAGRVARVRVDMGEPILTPRAGPHDPAGRSAASPAAPRSTCPLDVGGRALRVTCVSMGNPHCVTFVEQLERPLGAGASARGSKPIRIFPTA